MRANRHLLAIIALFIIGLAVRFLPLLFSNLPFNIDGFPLVRISEDIVETGHWSLYYSQGTSENLLYNTKMPVFSVLISVFSLIFGKTPMEITQVMVPLISSSALVIIYLIAFRITGNEMVSFFVGLALALNGFYVYLGAAVMKETVGLVILLLGIYLYHGRNDPRKRVIAGVLILILALTHHLTAWICFIMISLMMFTTHILQWRNGMFSRKDFVIDFISGPFLFIFTIMYYQWVNLPFFNKISNMNDVALFASVLLLGVIFSIMFSMPKKRKKPRNVLLNKTIIVPILGIAVIISNHYIMLFPGTIRTTSSLLKYMIPYFLLCSIAFLGLNVVASRKTEHKPFIASILLAPFLIIFFAMVKGLDAFTFTLIYRSYDYIDFGLAICAGIGVGYLINRAVKRLTREDTSTSSSFRIKTALSITFFVICLSTVPLAYQGQEFYGVQDATYNYEFTAIKWMDENSAEYLINSDERLCDIMNPYFDLECEKTLPWRLKWGKVLENNTLLFMEDKWLSAGAQMSPMEPIKISNATFSRTLNENNLIYTSGPSGSQIYIIKVG